MSDYVQVNDYSAKDALANGDPEKIILGSDIDDELAGISAAIATKFDSGDLASQAQAEAEASNVVLMTPLRLANWADYNAGIVGDLQALADPGADRILFWDESANAAVGLAVDGTTISISTTTLSTGSNVPLLNAANTFTTAQNIQSGSPYLALYQTGQASNAGTWFFGATGTGQLIAQTRTDAGGAGESFLTVERSGVEVTSLALAADSITVNGVNVTDFARKSQANTFTQTQTISGQQSLLVTATGVQCTLQSINNTKTQFGTIEAMPLHFLTNSADRYVISAGGAHDFKGGAVLASTIANSDSETLVAGQLHFIDGNATLPNLTAGQWVQVINDSGSSITISKNGSDTTYWATTGATVSTSFTLAARGVLTARANPAGTSVYVTGSGITGAS